MIMSISQESYLDLKEYWDYQRKVEYNREQMKKMADQFESRIYNDFGAVNIEQFKEKLWSRIEPEEYEDPPKGWVPEDENYRLWNEEYPPKPPLLTKPKGRPVVLRAKKLDTESKV